MKKIAIFLNGRHAQSMMKLTSQTASFPLIQKNQNASDSKVIIFAADNGFKRIIKEKLRYSKLHLFGDFDSLSETHLRKARESKNIVIDLFAKEKNMSDFACILDHIRAEHSDTHPFFIEIYGGLGKARDHEYANIKEAENFLSQSEHGGIIVFQGGVVLSTLPFALTNIRNKHFTLFSNSKLEFALHNAKYSGTMSLNRPSHGLSNRIERSPLIIERDLSPEILTLVLRNE